MALNKLGRIRPSWGGNCPVLRFWHHCHFETTSGHQQWPVISWLLPSRHQHSYLRTAFNERENLTEIIFNERENLTEIIFNKRENSAEIIFNGRENSAEIIFNERENSTEIIFNELENSAEIIVNERENSAEIISLQDWKSSLKVSKKNQI